MNITTKLVVNAHSNHVDAQQQDYSIGCVVRFTHFGGGRPSAAEVLEHLEDGLVSALDQYKEYLVTYNE